MKKIGITIVSIIGLLALSSCATKHNGPFLSATPGSPAITAPADGSAYVLSKDKASDTLVTMKWDAPNYGFPAAVTYTVQMGKQGEDFANPVKLGTANLPSFSITQGDLNSTLLGSGYIPDQAATVEVRVIASISDSVKDEMSPAIAVTFTPYSSYSYIYVPGDYQAASGYTSDWSPADAPPLVMTGNKIYDGYVYMMNSSGSAQFKFTYDKSWDQNWGDTGADGTLEAGGDNIVSPGTGYFKIHVDLDALTYKIEKTTWGLIGDATPGGWDTDTPMTYDPAKKVWSATVDLTAGGLKFRANNAWDLNYGDSGADGTLDAGGDNISVSVAGNYTVTMDLSNPPMYTYKLTKN